MTWLVRVKVMLRADKKHLEKPLSLIKGVLQAELYRRSQELMLTCGRQIQHPPDVVSTSGLYLFLLARALSGLMPRFYRKHFAMPPPLS